MTYAELQRATWKRVARRKDKPVDPDRHRIVVADDVTRR
jgi:hypothetical protein